MEERENFYKKKQQELVEETERFFANNLGLNLQHIPEWMLQMGQINSVDENCEANRV